MSFRAFGAVGLWPLWRTTTPLAQWFRCVIWLSQCCDACYLLASRKAPLVAAHKNPEPKNRPGNTYSKKAQKPRSRNLSAKTLCLKKTSLVHNFFGSVVFGPFFSGVPRRNLNFSLSGIEGTGVTVAEAEHLEDTERGHERPLTTEGSNRESEDDAEDEVLRETERSVRDHGS